MKPLDSDITSAPDLAKAGSEKAGSEKVRVEPSSSIARIVLARPEKRNAFDAETIAKITQALASLAQQPPRALAILAEGSAFCAGADLGWMRAMAQADAQTNLEDARALAAMLHALDTFPAPTVCFVHGPAYAGATGIVAACDIALAAPSARFALTEAKLGLAPAVIAPYLTRAMGARQTRRLALTAETFTANEALAWGLLHHILPEDDFHAAAMAWTRAQVLHAPKAQQEIKRLMLAMGPIETAMGDTTSRLIALIRTGEEAQAGLEAFFAKRAPPWQERQER